MNPEFLAGYLAALGDKAVLEDGLDACTADAQAAWDRAKKDNPIKFSIQIGDWSGDGHGRHKDYLATANKPIEQVREAYFKAKAALSEAICPENFCERYHDSKIPFGTWRLIQQHFPTITDDGIDGYDPSSPEAARYPDSEWMAKYVALFTMKGDADLTITLVPEEQVPTFAFYGSDEQERHISFIGYGLFHS